MRIIEYYRQNKKLYGTKTALKKVFQRGLQRIAGIDHLEPRIQHQQEELDTLFYFLNEYVDITRIPSASGALRTFQENDVLLLKVFDLICRQNNLTYWLSWGTLLGAVRHKGFIPWDDDLDVNMTREDFELAKSILPSAMTPLGFTVHINPSKSFESIGISYKDFGVWLDVFPMDRFCSELGYTEFRNDLFEGLRHHARKTRSQTLDWERSGELLKSLIEKKYRSGSTAYYIQYSPYQSVESTLVVEEKSILPVQSGFFEDISVMIPHEPNLCCARMYGSDYMKFPRTGVLHHISGLPTSDQLKERGTALAELLNTLEE